MLYCGYCGYCAWAGRESPSVSAEKINRANEKDLIVVPVVTMHLLWLVNGTVEMQGAFSRAWRVTVASRNLVAW